MGGLVDRGNSLLIFPEGHRTADGNIRPFRNGVGFIASKLDIPVVPVYIHGLFDRMPRGGAWPRPGRITVRLGMAMQRRPSEDYASLTRRVEDAVQRLSREED